jgi:acetyltransferase-like isoleucine patch superfamily enzyme
MEMTIMSEFQPLARAKSEDPLDLFSQVAHKLHRGWLRSTYPFAHLGKKPHIHPSCNLKKNIAHRIWIGDNVNLAKDVHLGISAPVEEEGPPLLIIEDNSLVHWRSQIDAKNQIHIERNVLITQDVLIIDHGHAYEDVSVPIERFAYSEGGSIRIGEGSWIGHGAAIICTKGELVLGRHCVVGANAVVTKSAPPYSVLSGNPARIIRQYDPAKEMWVMGSVRSLQPQMAE